MLKIITKQNLVIVLLLISANANAQQWLGRTTGNYNGTYGVYNNAASIADSKYKYYFNFWGRGINFYNNYLEYNAPIKLNEWANGSYFDQQYTRIDGKADYKKNWLLEDLNGKDKQFSFNQDIWGPSFLFPVGKKASMSINTRQRSSLQLFGISEPFARMAFNGLDSSGGIYSSSDALKRNTKYSNGKFGSNAQSYQELSFTYAGIISKSEHHQWNGGLTVKFIRGLGATYLKGDNLDLTINGNNSATIGSNGLDYAYTNDKSVVAPFNKPYGLFTLQSKGAGAGLDLGLTYSYTSQKGKYATNKACNNNNLRNDYDFKLAMGINDLGGVKYNRNSTKYTFNAANSGIGVSKNILNGFNQPTQNALDTIGKNVFGQMGANKSSGFSTSLPTALNIQADFRLAKNIYTSVYWNQSLKGINSTGMRSTSMLSIIPRVESRGFEFSMPITLSENYKNVYIGTYVRVGPVFFGSDNLGGLLNVSSNSNFRGADIYGGISFGIGHCNRTWGEDKVDPVYQDTVKQKDTVKIVQKDTIRIIKRDTVYLKKGEVKTVIKHDTVYIEKIIKTTVDNTKEKELKQKEIDLNTKQKQLEQREKEILEKEKGTYNETEAIKICKNQNTVLNSDNVILRNKVITQTDEILILQKQIDELKRNKTQQDAEILSLKKCNDVIKYDEATGKPLTPCQLYERELAKRKQCETEKALNLAEIERLKTEIIDLRKSENVKTDGQVIKGNDADKLVKANKKIDSLNSVLIVLNSELDKCKKTNGTINNAEIIKAKAETVQAKKTADSLNIILVQRNTELENCKKGNGTQNDAEILKAKTEKEKAENNAKWAAKKADSLQNILNATIVDLENCKKSTTNCDTYIAQLAKCKNEKENCSIEMAAMVKILGEKNTRINGMTNKIDSLILQLKKCNDSKDNNGGNNDQLLKACNDAKDALNAEVIVLKNAAKAYTKSLDSMEAVTNALRKQKTDLEDQVADLKAKQTETNCDEYKKQIEDKNATIQELNNQNSTLQNKVSSLTAQFNQLLTEYNFLNAKNQLCSKQLDTCIRGLSKHGSEGQPHQNGGSGPNGGSNTSDDEVYSSAEKIEKVGNAIKLGVGILKILSQTTTNRNQPSSTPSSTPKPETKERTNSTSGTTKPTENSGNSGSGTTATSTRSAVPATSGNESTRIR